MLTGERINLKRDRTMWHRSILGGILFLGIFSCPAWSYAEEQLPDPDSWFSEAMRGPYRTVPRELLDTYGVNLVDSLAPYLSSDDEREARSALDFLSALLFQLKNTTERTECSRRVLRLLGENPRPTTLRKVYWMLDSDDFTDEMKAAVGSAIAQALSDDSLGIDEIMAGISLINRGLIASQRGLVESYVESEVPSHIDFEVDHWKLYWQALCTSARFGNKTALRTAIHFYENAEAPLPKYEPMLGALASTRQPELLDILIPLLDAEGWVYEPRGDVVGQSIKRQAFQLTLSFFDDLPTDISREEMVDWLKGHYADGTLPPIVYTYDTPWIPDSAKAIVSHPAIE